MRSRAAVCLVAGLAAALSGCATAANVFWWIPEEGGARVYGGVRAHPESLRGTFSSDSSESAEARHKAVLFAVVDLPLSAAGDTLRLPYTIPASLLNQRDKQVHTDAFLDSPPVDPEGPPAGVMNGNWKPPP